MLYATETVLALHRARTQDEQRARTALERQEERTAREFPQRVTLRPAPAR